MSILSANQIAGYAQQAGFTGSSLTTAVAIALAESQPSGNTQSYNPEIAAGTPVGSGSRGLWQIYGYVHPQYNNDSLYDPLTNARAAYAISQQGHNFNAWSTYTNGSYLSKMAQAQAGIQGSTSISMSTVVNADKVKWVSYPRIDNLGGVEPFGGFAKPDTNIQLPALFPVQALLPGTVTALDGGNVAWGAVVTIRLDTPLNSLATHTAYLHLNSTKVRVGQHVNVGDTIGLNGGSAAAGSQKVPLGFALYNGDHYGLGSAWALETAQNLQGPLNPVPYIEAAKNGTLLTTGGTQGELFSTSVTSIQNGVQLAHDLVNEIPGFTGICEALDAVEQFVPFQLPTQAQNDINTATQNTDVTIFGWDTGINNPFSSASAAQAAIQLPSDSIQAVLVFTTTNAGAFLVRSIFVVCGLVLFISLMSNLVGQFVSTDDVKQFASLALDAA